MNILVTGGRGQLGYALQSVGGEYQRHTFVFTDMPELDITDRAMVSEMIDRHTIDIIVNCAAYTAVDRAESEAELAEKINVDGPRTLAEACVDKGVKLIHISTDYVFSGESCHPLKEDEQTGPTGVYGRTKLAGERAIEASGCDAVIIRTAWLYSEFGANFVKTMLRVAEQKDSLNVVYDQIGTPTYAPDLARAIIGIAERGELAGRGECGERGGIDRHDGRGECGERGGRVFEVYHFSNEGVASWYDFARAIFTLAGVNVEVNAIESSLYPTPAHRPAYSVLSKDKIKAIGVRVPYWRESLERCIDIIIKG